MDAQEAIEVQTAGEPPSAVAELFLAGCTVPGLEEPSLERLSLELAPFVHLRILSLNCCSLRFLESFPVLPKLRVLELADNQLTGKPGLPGIPSHPKGHQREGGGCVLSQATSSHSAPPRSSR